MISIIENLPDPNIPKEEKKEAVEWFAKCGKYTDTTKVALLNAIIYLDDLIDWDKPDWHEKYMAEVRKR